MNNMAFRFSSSHHHSSSATTKLPAALGTNFMIRLDRYPIFIFMCQFSFSTAYPLMKNSIHEAIKIEGRRAGWVGATWDRNTPGIQQKLRNVQDIDFYSFFSLKRRKNLLIDSPLVDFFSSLLKVEHRNSSICVFMKRMKLLFRNAYDVGGRKVNKNWKRSEKKYFCLTKVCK